MPKRRAAESSDALEYGPRMTDIAASERPRERLKRHGASALRNDELLAILLRVGTRGENVMRLAERLLHDFRNLTGLLRADLSELGALHGMGESKALQIKAALELARRLSIESPDERPAIKSPADAANLLSGEMGVLDQEEMRVILLDTRNRVIATKRIYTGNVNSAIVRVGELFRDAIRQNCPAIIVAHNHPSGDPAPSPEDVRVTEEMVAAGKLLDIDVLDHIVIGQGRFVSLKERGLGFG